MCLEILKSLLGDELEAIASYEAALPQVPRDVAATLRHILSEEKEHAIELRKYIGRGTMASGEKARAANNAARDQRTNLGRGKSPGDVDG